MTQFLKRWALWIIIAIIIGAIGYAIFGSATLEPDFDRTGPYLVHHGILVVVLLGALIAGRPSLGEVGRAVALWGGLALVLVAGYSYRGELQAIGNRTLSALVPGMVVSEPGSGGAVSVMRGEYNHFVVSARVNQAEIEFLVDTGASIITLTDDDARQAGIAVDSLRYTIPVSTANGRAMVAPIVLSNISVGQISINGLHAMVAQPGRLSQSLLGMNFMERLSGWRVDGDRLILTP